jgi:catechol 2,3-dioxygenase-like lactoylglutathione lyase family enzyme
MIGNFDATATIGVKNLDAAGKFYEEKLGFKIANEPQEPETRTYLSGHSKLLIYKSQFAGTNQATAATWMVDDVEKLARELAAKGVTFEHYDMPNVTRKGDVHYGGKIKVAWIKDPDGNILSVASRSHQ